LENVTADLARTKIVTRMTFLKLTSFIHCRFLPLLLAAGVALLALTAHAAPRKPSNDSEVLERLPTRAGDASARELLALRAAMAAAANDPLPAGRLAQRYFDLAMARGDPRYVGYAEAVIAGFPEPLPPELLSTRGMLRQYRHGFQAALDDFAAALALDPQLAQAHAWRAAIFLVQANYAAAQQECAALQALGKTILQASCSGLAQAYGGQLAAGYGALQQALASSRDPDNRLWLLTRLGEVAAWRGQPKLAEEHYREALSIGRDDGYLLAAWSDFLLDTGRPAEVLRELADWEASDTLLLRLAEAAALENSPDAARLAQTLDERFAAARQRGDTTHRAEEARYALHLRKDPASAVRLAADNYAVQREPRDARILLEAAIAAGDAAAAQPARDWLRDSGFEDQRLRELGQRSAPGPAQAASRAGAPR
jgi:Tfp pilus assembly protein PilF